MLNAAYQVTSGVVNHRRYHGGMRTREETGEYNPIAIVKDPCEELKCSMDIGVFACGSNDPWISAISWCIQFDTLGDACSASVNVLNFESNIDYPASSMALVPRFRQNTGNPYENVSDEERSFFNVIIFICDGVGSNHISTYVKREFGQLIHSNLASNGDMNTRFTRIGLDDIGDSGGQRSTCYYMAKDGSFHSSNGWTTDWMNSINVCSHCTGSISGDVAASRVLATDGHSWPPLTDFGDERPPPEPPPIARPPPEPPPMRNST